jgi:exopolysaccharide biosynthesis protein
MDNLRFVITTKLLIAAISLCCSPLAAQLRWVNIDAAYAPLPNGFNIFKTTDSLDGYPFIAVYAIANLKNKQLDFTSDTTLKRRLTPTRFYKKNNQPLLVVNSTFFSFSTNQNLNIVVKDGQLVSYNIHSVPGKGKDTLTYRHPYGSALGITNKRTADIAWTWSDSSKKFAYATQSVIDASKDSLNKEIFALVSSTSLKVLKKWKMKTAVGGGPVLVQNGQVKITNNEEMKFAGKAISDQHPRTLMGHTKDHKLIVMVIEGRNPGVAAGATLQQAAQLMVDLGCVEALNLDGGGSSCMLINGKETIKPSDKGVERAVPAVFIIQQKH